MTYVINNQRSLTNTAGRVLNLPIFRSIGSTGNISITPINRNYTFIAQKDYANNSDSFFTRVNYVVSKVLSRAWTCKLCSATADPYVNGIICPTCRHVRAFNANLSPFEVLAVEPVYDVDMDFVNYNYRKLQQSLHPDVTPVTRNITKWNMALPNVIEQMRSNVLRAETLMILRGLTTRSALDNYEISDMILMMESLEVLETLGKVLDRAKRDKLTESDENYVNKITDEWNSKRDISTKKISKEFLSENTSTEILLEALAQLRVAYRVENALRAIEDLSYSD